MGILVGIVVGAIVVLLLFVAIGFFGALWGANGANAQDEQSRRLIRAYADRHGLTWAQASEQLVADVSSWEAQHGPATVLEHSRRILGD